MKQMVIPPMIMSHWEGPNSLGQSRYFPLATVAVEKLLGSCFVRRWHPDKRHQDSPEASDTLCLARV